MISYASGLSTSPLRARLNNPSLHRAVWVLLISSFVILSFSTSWSPLIILTVSAFAPLPLPTSQRSLPLATHPSFTLCTSSTSAFSSTTQTRGQRGSGGVIKGYRSLDGRLFNLYDDWRSGSLRSEDYEGFSDLPLEEEFVEQCLEEFIDSNYGKQMFGKHDKPASVEITGSIELDMLDGPEVTLALSGRFWHRRETVLGRAAMYINARIPEATSVNVASLEELADFEDVIDDVTGELLYVEDKRSPDFNGDRGTMEYQGIDPDGRGPFLSGGDGGMLIPA